MDNELKYIIKKEENTSEVSQIKPKNKHHLFRNIWIIIFVFLFVFVSLLTECVTVPLRFKPINKNYDFVPLTSSEYLDSKESNANFKDVFEKELKDEDYKLIYEQTGLTKIGFDRFKDNYDLYLNDLHEDRKAKQVKDRFEYIHSDNFDTDKKITSYYITPFFSFVDIDTSISKEAQICYLKPGDVIISESTHLLGISLGHAQFITDIDKVYPENSLCIESSSYGVLSEISTVHGIESKVKFSILEPKKELFPDEVLKEIVAYGNSSAVLNIPYSFIVGLTTKKSDLNYTQCAHIVWYIFNKFGYDIDYDKGIFVSPYDILKSEYFSLVQSYNSNVRDDIL